MKRMAVVLLALLVLVQCGAELRRFPLFLPIVAQAPVGPKGAALFAWDCDTVRLLDLDWYYIGTPGCWPAQFVYYEEAPGLNGTATQYTMFYNEPEHNGWSVAEMVAAFVPYAAHYPRTVWVGPCVAYDLDLVPQFWEAFARQAGYAMPPERIRLCFHCYYEARQCLERVRQAAAVANWMGLPERSLWLTEFGQPLGLSRTVGRQLEQVRTLLAGLESSPYVERYAYWPGLYWPLPGAPEPYAGALPLLYPVYRGQQVVGYRLTAMGEFYRSW